MKRMTIEAVIDSIPAVTEFVDEELERLECPMRAQMQLSVAIDELFSNIARYAYTPGTGTATVCVEAVDAPPGVEITFIDKGVPYNPLETVEPDVSLPAEERKIGGLGIFLVRKTMDDVRYEHRDGQNVLTIRKNF